MIVTNAELKRFHHGCHDWVVVASQHRRSPYYNLNCRFFYDTRIPSLCMLFHALYAWRHSQSWSNLRHVNFQPFSKTSANLMVKFNNHWCCTCRKEIGPNNFSIMHTFHNDRASDGISTHYNATNI